MPTKQPEFVVGDCVRERFLTRVSAQSGVVIQQYEFDHRYRYVVHFDDDREGVFFDWELIRSDAYPLHNA